MGFLLNLGSQDTILDLASMDTQTSLCQQLQHLGNAAQHLESPDGPSEIPAATVTFDFLGLGEVKAVVSIEYDQLLDALVGSMVIRNSTAAASAASALTESNLRKLPSNAAGGASGASGASGRGGRGGRGRGRSERSHGSSRRSSCSSRGSSGSSPATATGAISELRVKVKKLTLWGGGLQGHWIRKFGDFGEHN